MNEKVLELINYYIERYKETKRDEFIIAGFNQMRILVNNLRPEFIPIDDDEKGKMDKAYASIQTICDMVNSKIGNVLNMKDIDMRLSVSGIALSDGNRSEYEAIDAINRTITSISFSIATILLSPYDDLKLFNYNIADNRIGASTTWILCQNIDTLMRIESKDHYDTLGYANQSWLDEISTVGTSVMKAHIARILTDAKDKEYLHKVFAETEVVDPYHVKKDTKDYGVGAVLKKLVKFGVVDNDFNILVKPATDEDYKKWTDLIDKFKEYYVKKVEVEKKFYSIMNRLPEVMCDEWYVGTDDIGDYNLLHDLWINNIWCTNIQAIDKMKCILDDALKEYDVYRKLLDKPIK